jgi:large subunit ribosomal protein L15
MRAKFPYKKRRKRVGCGQGSGHGKTSCKGNKGQKARSGQTRMPGFEGGQNPFYRRIPKRGFNNADFKWQYAIVNTDKIAALGLSEVTPEILKAHGIIHDVKDGLRILGDGDLTTAVTVKAHYFTESARKKIEAAGGQAVLITRTPKLKTKKD